MVIGLFSGKGLKLLIGPYVCSPGTVVGLETFHGETSMCLSGLGFAGTQFRDGVETVVMIDGFEEVPVHIIGMDPSYERFEPPIEMNDFHVVCGIVGRVVDHM